MSTESILNKQGVTIQGAKDFIESNVKLNQPEIIFTAALDHAVTTSMLNEITGYSIDEINTYFLEYFKSIGIDDHDSFKRISELNEIGKLVNSDSDLEDLKDLIALNNYSKGVLSTSSLQGKVKPLINSDVSEEFDTDFFAPIYSFQQKTGYVYDPEELGVKGLNNIAATTEITASIFYGTLINVFSRLDNSELDQINKFSGDQNSEAYRTFLHTSLTSISITPRTNEELANLVVTEAVRIVQASDIFLPDHGIHILDNIGILDHSFLGLSVL
jgi:hypothetical protein